VQEPLPNKTIWSFQGLRKTFVLNAASRLLKVYFTFESLFLFNLENKP
jgi:hypothetical protein